MSVFSFFIFIFPFENLSQSITRDKLQNSIKSFGINFVSVNCGCFIDAKSIAFGIVFRKKFRILLINGFILRKFLHYFFCDKITF